MKEKQKKYTQKILKKNIGNDNYITSIIYDINTLNKKTISYYKNNILHRDGDKPAHIEFYDNELKYRELYYKNGKLHRDGDKPAEVYYSSEKHNKQYSFYHYKNGKLHRDGDKPAVLKYKPKTSTPFYIEYYKNGKLHRDDDKPATIRISIIEECNCCEKIEKLRIYEKYFINGYFIISRHNDTFYNEHMSLNCYKLLTFEKYYKFDYFDDYFDDNKQYCI